MSAPSDENKRPTQQKDDNRRPPPAALDSLALSVITARSGNVNSGYRDPTTTSPRPLDHRAAAVPDSTPRQTPGISENPLQQLPSLSEILDDHATRIEPVQLYEQPLDTEFPLNFDDSAERTDYHGDGDLLSKRFRLMRLEFFEYVRSIQPPVSAGLTLSTFVTGQALAMNPDDPKTTRLCFATHMGKGHGHRHHEIHTQKLKIIQKYCPQEDFPELYPLRIRYFMSYDVLLASTEEEGTAEPDWTSPASFRQRYSGKAPQTTSDMNKKVLWRKETPVSTTQCIIGATVGVGLCAGDYKAINWRMVTWAYMGWFVTLPSTALISGLLMAFTINAPQWGRTPAAVPIV